MAHRLDPNEFITPEGVSDKDHSKALDKTYGFKINQIEQNLLKKYRAFYKRADDGNKKKHFYGTETWVGLDPQVLLTPYQEILDFLELFKSNPPEKIVDLGAAYGRVAIVAQALYPECSFTGFEIIKARVDEAMRIFDKLAISESEVIEKNILKDDFKLPDADLYFIYDFSDPVDLKYMLNQLSEKMNKRSFYLVAKGKGVRSMIQSKFPEYFSCYEPIHRKEWSVYRTP